MRHLKDLLEKLSNAHGVSGMKKPVKATPVTVMKMSDLEKSAKLIVNAVESRFF